MRSLVLAALLAATSSSLAGTIAGRVVAVQDGDTLTLLAERRQIRVRLVDIDAPERKQTFGSRSRQSLAELCHGKDARVDDRGQDRYGRTLGRVICSGADANREQVRRGLAWVYVRYAPKDSPLFAIEATARAAKVGLWTDRRPIPPWEWRARQRIRR